MQSAPSKRHIAPIALVPVPVPSPCPGAGRVLRTLLATTGFDYAKQIMEKVLHQLRPDFSRCCFSVDDFFNYLFLDKFNRPIDYKVCKISNSCYLCCLSNLISVASF
ncbi:hypothetical protein Hanom_Chr07g00675321 [Helianthus anomalus]